MSFDPAAAAAAMRPLASDPAHADAAAAGLQRWLSEEAFAPYRPLVRALLDAGAWDTLLDSFYRVLPFGTGGRRGPVGVGPNRINPWSLGTSVQGHVAFLRRRFPDEEELSVVIAADVRVFRDLRGALPAGVDNPLLGMRSNDLAVQAAAIYAANGVLVHMLDPDAGRFMATPELSFAIRRLGAHGGLNVSASHNHPDDNGGKFYTELGAQEVPPHDERMVEEVERVDSVRTMPWRDAVASGRVRFVPDSLHEAYLAESSRVLRGDARGARVVYTNLHGVGDATVGEALERAGFEVHYCEEQRAHDGLFPGVRFRAPNPEYESAYGPALELARRVGADLVLASDPDADRIGAMVPADGDPAGDWRFLNGQELSALVAAARFEGAPAGRIGIKTEVTTELFSRVVRAAGGQVVGHLLVGCKYIAGVMRDLETTGRSGEVEGSLEDVLIGTEESHGFLLTGDIRDKDAAAPALVLAELASERKAAGSTLSEAMDALYRRHGAIANVQVPLVMSGAVGRTRILGIQESLRAEPPSRIGAHEVTAFFDRRDEAGVFGPIVSETDHASRDVLAFHLGADRRLVIRPSGTEPKTKIYAEVSVEAGDDLQAALHRAREQARELAEDFTALALARVGLALPEAGLRCSALLDVDSRLVFADEVLPALVARAEAGEGSASLRAFLEDRIGAWGGDGLGLCRSGWEAFRASAPPSAAALAALDEAWKA